MGQSSFTVVQSREDKRWETFRKQIQELYNQFDRGEIVNNIDNQLLLFKLISKMDDLDKEYKQRKVGRY